MLKNYADGLVHHRFNNGLTILIYPINTIPQVSMQLWYNVGSKDEQRGQKGLAHFLEHMIFKGTKKLSETDLIAITQKLSGSCNAFTSQDYTGYLFDFPSHQWEIGFELLADCMRNCVFKQDLLDSELAAVMQELRLYKDDYESSLEEEMIVAIFDQHPYHYPVIGFKQDLWVTSPEGMSNFYHKHYIPNNATLVVVGDINHDYCIEQADKFFGALKADVTYHKQQYFYTNSMTAKSITLYRDLEQASATMAFVIPGLREKQSYLVDVISWILGNGKGSRLYKKLVDELQLVTHIETYSAGLFEHDVFFIRFQPQEIADIPKINELILQEINNLALSGASKAELLRATKQVETDYLELFEDNEELAHEIARCYVATGDPLYALNYLESDSTILNDKIQRLLSTYCKPLLAHTGSVIPIPERDQDYWVCMQEATDELDQAMTAKRQRTTALEPLRYAQTIAAKIPPASTFPHFSSFLLYNNCKVLYHDNPLLPTIDLIIAFKDCYYVDPIDKQGLYNFVMALLLEGTASYSAQQLADEFEMYGMAVDAKPGYIALHMLSKDLEHALKLLDEIIHRPLFDKDVLEKVRQQLVAQIKEYWDDPYSCIDQLAKQAVYKDHPHGRNALGTVESIMSITHQDIVDFYSQHITLADARIALSGDLGAYDIPIVCKRIFTQRPYSMQKNVEMPPVKATVGALLEYPMQRDQIALCYAGISIARMDKDYDALLLFDQLLTGGGSGSMSSLLFQLREQSGLFYTIKGSLLSYVDKQPGMIFIKTLVSVDKVHETEQRILDTLINAVDQITESNLQEAKNLLINGLAQHMASNSQRAQLFLFIDRFDLPVDYFDKRAQQLQAVSLEEVKDCVKRLLHAESLYKIRVGRVNDIKKME